MPIVVFDENKKQALEGYKDRSIVFVNSLLVSARTLILGMLDS